MGNQESTVWPKVHTLRLGFNQLTNVSDLCSCISSQNVTILDFGNNKITMFPSSVLKWQSSEVLDLANNDLSEVPFELGLMEGLNALMLSGNRLKRMQSIINAGNTQKILESFRSRI